MNRLADAVRVRTPVGQIAVRDSGASGSSTVVLLHGLLLDGATNYANAADALDGYRVVTVDLLGHGGTIRSVPCSTAANVSGVLAVLEHLSIEQPVLVGYSYGGAVAHDVADACNASGAVYIATAGVFTERAGVSAAARRAAEAVRLVPGLPWRPLDAATLTGRRAQLVAAFDGAGVLGTALAAIGREDKPVWTGPSVHVITEHDRVVGPALQRSFALRTGGVVHPVPAGHFLHRDDSFPHVVRSAVDAVWALAGE